MAAAKKPTAQQKAQAKARAGGNNPIKVTNAGVKRLGKAALIAGSLTPAGRGVKAASMAVKAVKAAKSAKAVKAVSRESVSNMKPHPKGIKVKASDNVNVIIKEKPNYEFNKDLSTIGKIQKQNAKSPKATKAEVKANARGLKAANKPKGKKMSSKDIKKFENFIDVQIKKL